MHWFATDLGAGGRSGPLRVQIIRDIATDNEATARLLRVLNHEIRPAELFTPRRLGVAAARVARGRPRQIPLLLKETAVGVRDELRRTRARPIASASCDIEQALRLRPPPQLASRASERQHEFA